MRSAVGFPWLRRRGLALFQKGLEKVEVLGDGYLGLGPAHSSAAVRTCRDAVAALGEPRIADFNPALIPKLRPLRPESP